MAAEAWSCWHWSGARAQTGCVGPRRRCAGSNPGAGPDANRTKCPTSCQSDSRTTSVISSNLFDLAAVRCWLDSSWRSVDPSMGLDESRRSSHGGPNAFDGVASGWNAESSVDRVRVSSFRSPQAFPLDLSNLWRHGGAWEACVIEVGRALVRHGRLERGRCRWLPSWRRSVRGLVRRREIPWRTSDVRRSH